MRRTLQALGRAAQVHDFVVRSISGHATVGMQAPDSTVAGEELRQGLAKAVSLAGFRAALAAGSGAVVIPVVNRPPKTQKGQPLLPANPS